MRLFRIGASLLLGLASLGSASAEEIANWAAPPYWTAPSESQPRDHHAAMEAKGVATAAATPLPFVAVAPCRVADTRGNGFSGAYGPPSLSAGVSRDFPMTSVCGIPATAQAVSMNVTVTNTLGAGHITIYPQGGVAPTVSTLNYVANLTVANAAVVVLGTGGGVTVVAAVSGTDFIIDVNGYYDPQGVVNAVNGLSGDVAVAPGANISITPSGNTLTVAATGVVTGVNALSGNVALAPGANVSITPSGNTLTVAATGVVTGVNGLSGNVALTPGANVSITPSGNTLTVAATGIATTINTLSGAVVLAPGTNISITPSGNTLTISSTGFALTANNSGGSTFTGAGFGSATITGDITASSIIQCTYTGTGVTSKPIIVESQGVGSAVVRGESGTTFRYVIFN